MTAGKRENSLEGEIRKQSKAGVKKKLHKVLHIRLAHAVACPGTMVVHSQHTLLAGFAVMAS